MNSQSLRFLCLVLSACAIGAGCLGMVASFLYLASSSMADITAGTSGFIAGSVLVGSGLISLTLLAITPGPGARPGEGGPAGNRFETGDVAWGEGSGKITPDRPGRPPFRVE